MIVVPVVVPTFPPTCIRFLNVSSSFFLLLRVRSTYVGSTIWESWLKNKTLEQEPFIRASKLSLDACEMLKLIKLFLQVNFGLQIKQVPIFQSSLANIIILVNDCALDIKRVCLYDRIVTLCRRLQSIIVLRRYSVLVYLYMLTFDVI